MWSTSPSHPTTDDLERYLYGEDASPDAGEHLEQGCIRCVTRASERLRQPAAARARLRSWLRGLYGSTGDTERDTLRHEIAGGIEAFGRIVQYEEAAGPALLETLLALQSQARRTAIRNRRQYQTLGFARHLTAAARQEVFQDVERAVELGELAVEVAELLEEAGYSRGQANDARALAWAALANAHRVASDLPTADRALRQALALSREGSGDPVVQAELLSLEGSLRMNQARFKEARQVLEAAAESFARQGDRESEARALTKVGKALGDSGMSEEAVGVLERAEGLLDGDGLELQRLYARQLRAMVLADSGRASEARELLERIRPVWIREAPGFANQQRLLWLDGRISWSEGDLAAAEAKLLEVRAGWEERDELYELALVSLDLATIYLVQGRTAEVKDLATGMLPVFRSQDVHHHAMAALVLVQRAIEAEQVTVTLLQDVARYLRLARSNASLAYSAPQ